MWQTESAPPIPLTVPAVQALTDGQFFLEHLSVLRGVAIEPYCRRCHALGLASTVSVVTTPEEFTFRCEHAAGFVKRDQFLELQPLLGALGWDLRCTKCAQWIEGENSRTDATFLVSCPCSLRMLANPAAQRLSATDHLPEVAGLGGQESV